MSDEEQIPLPETLQLNSPELGTYIHQSPSSICFGAVAFGGFTVSFIHKAAAHFTAQSPKTADHRDIHQSSIQFFRPLLPAPQEIVLRITIASANKGWTVLHAELLQTRKLCNAGYITLCDFSKPGTLTVKYDWQLSPPAPPVDLAALSNDADPRWVTYHTPWNPNGLRRPHMYVSHSVPSSQLPAHSRHIADQWLRATWPESDGKPALWTDELIPFVFDSAIPVMIEVIDPSWGFWSSLLEAAKEQARVRASGEADSGVGDNKELWGADRPFPWIGATLSMTMEIKKRLPAGGVPYLMVRAVMKQLIDNRADYELIILDEQGDLVAVGSQVTMILPIAVKSDKYKLDGVKL